MTAIHGDGVEHDQVLQPGEFLQQVRQATPGWSDRHGGPEGVALLTVVLQDALKVQAQELAAVRATAIHELLTTRSLADVAKLLGVSKQAVSKAAHGPRWRNSQW